MKALKVGETQWEVVRNPMHPTMPDYLKRGEFLVIAIQAGTVIGLCAFENRNDAWCRAHFEYKQHKRIRSVYSSGFNVQNADGTWSVS